MSWFSLKLDVQPLVAELRLIRLALERIAPLPDEPAPDLKPEDAVQYVDESQMDRAEAIHEMGEEAERLLAYAQEHPEEFPEAEL